MLANVVLIRECIFSCGMVVFGRRITKFIFSSVFGMIIILTKSAEWLKENGLRLILRYW